MFKPMLHSTPMPYTNAERKARQYGLIPATKNITLPFDGKAVLWGYERPVGWYVQDDFVGENENEGYVHSAPPIAAVTMVKSGNTLTTTFRFQGSAANGGIMPSQLTVPNFTPDGQSMANLYPGVVLYLFSSSTGSYQPKSIYTADAVIGSRTMVELQSPINFQGSGLFIALPVFSKDKHVPAASITGGNETVLVAHNAMLSYDYDDYGVGAMLFTRRYIGINSFGQNVGTGYLLYSGMGYTYSKLSDGLDNYSWVFLQSYSLMLKPQKDLTDEFNKDKRLSVTITFKNNSSYGYGLGDWSPVMARITGSNRLSSGNFDTLKATTETYGLCRWSGGVDGDTYYLALRYIPTSGTWDSETNWSIEYSRVLVLIDEFGTEIWKSENGSAYKKSVSGGAVVTEGQGLRVIRFGNVIASNAAYNSATGLYATFETSGNITRRWSVGNNLGYISFDSEDRSMWFNVSETDLRIAKIPTTTEMYIDVTVDTETTVKDNQLFN